MRKAVIVSFIFFLGCGETPKEKGTTLAVTKIVNNSELPQPPPSPYSYYGWFNFIFDSDGNLFFYQHFWDRKKKPVRVIDFGSDSPVFISLNPNQIVEIPENGLEAFVKQNLLNVEQAARDVRVVGVTDTIKSKSLDPLLKVLTDTSNHINFSVRKITYEESVVIEYKKKQKFYNPERVNWDSTKVFFDRKRME